jgi:hypothetical protein
MPVTLPGLPVAPPAGIPAAVQNGQPDSFFVAEVRRCLRDQSNTVQESPASDGQTGAYGNAASKPVRLQRAPIARLSFFLSAVAGATQPGFVSYNPLFDPPPPTFNPTVAPIISDGGAGGALAGASYQLVYTYILGSVEQGMSPPSNFATISSGHKITIAALSNLPSAVTGINYYLTSASAGGSTIGFLGSQAVTNNSTLTTTFSGPGNGVVPALVVSDTGELFFPLAPLTGTISVQYQAFRFSDQQIVDALYEGLDMLWPEIWTPQPFDTTSVLPSPVQWEYALPAIYADPRTVILDIEQRPPSAFIIFERISGWRFINDSTTPSLVFHRPPPVGGVVRITYATPYTLLAQTPSIAQFLPVYYALARIMSDQEVMRSRADDLPALTGENAGAEKGGSLQTAAWWMQNMFAPALGKLSLGLPARRSVIMRSVERLGLSSIWRGLA